MRRRHPRPRRMSALALRINRDRMKSDCDRYGPLNTAGYIFRLRPLMWHHSPLHTSTITTHKNIV